MLNSMKSKLVGLFVLLLSVSSQAVSINEYIDGGYLVKFKNTSGEHAQLAIFLASRYQLEGGRLNYFLLDGTLSEHVSNVPNDQCFGNYEIKDSVFSGTITYCQKTGPVANTQKLMIRFADDARYEDLSAAAVPTNLTFKTYREYRRYRWAHTLMRYKEGQRLFNSLDTLYNLLDLVDESIKKGSSGFDYRLVDNNRLAEIEPHRNLMKEGLLGMSVEEIQNKINSEFNVGLGGNLLAQSTTGKIQPMTKAVLSNRMRPGMGQVTTYWADDLGLLLEQVARIGYEPLAPITQPNGSLSLTKIPVPADVDDTVYMQAWFKCGTGSMHMRYEDKPCNKFAINSKVYKRGLPVVNFCLREAYKNANGQEFSKSTPIDVLHYGTYRAYPSSHYSSENLDLYGARFGQAKYDYFQSNARLVRALEAFLEKERPGIKEVEAYELQDLAEKFFAVNAQSSELESFKFWIPFLKCYGAFNVSYINWGDVGTFAIFGDQKTSGEPAGIVFQKGSRPGYYLKKVSPEWLGGRANTGHVNHIHLWMEDFRE